LIFSVPPPPLLTIYLKAFLAFLSPSRPVFPRSRMCIRGATCLTRVGVSLFTLEPPSVSAGRAAPSSRKGTFRLFLVNNNLERIHILLPRLFLSICSFFPSVGLRAQFSSAPRAELAATFRFFSSGRVSLKPFVVLPSPSQFV